VGYKEHKLFAVGVSTKLFLIRVQIIVGERKKGDERKKKMREFRRNRNNRAKGYGINVGKSLCPTHTTYKSEKKKYHRARKKKTEVRGREDMLLVWEGAMNFVWGGRGGARNVHVN